MFARPMVDLAESKEWMPPKIVRDNTKDQLNDGGSDSQLGGRTRNHVGCMMHDQSKSLVCLKERSGEANIFWSGMVRLQPALQVVHMSPSMYECISTP